MRRFVGTSIGFFFRYLIMVGELVLLLFPPPFPPFPGKTKDVEETPSLRFLSFFVVLIQKRETIKFPLLLYTYFPSPLSLEKFYCSIFSKTRQTNITKDFPSKTTTTGIADQVGTPPPTPFPLRTGRTVQ